MKRMTKEIRGFRFVALGAVVLLVGIACAEDSALHSDLSIAREALRDGLWSVARTHAEKVKEADVISAEMIILESFASENRWADVKDELAKIGNVSTNAAFGYYRAASEGNLDEAIRLLRTCGTRAEPSVRMLEADILVRQDDLTAARKLWREVLSMTNASERTRVEASVNLGDVELMRPVYSNVVSKALKRMVGLRLGRALVEGEKTFAEGDRLIRATVADSPDADGARAAFLSLLSAELRGGRWTETLKTSAEAIEIWPDVVRHPLLQECRGTALGKLGKGEEALAAFAQALEAAEDDSARARIILKEGELLSDLGRGEEAMARYRTVLEAYPSTETAIHLKRVVDLREKENRGRSLYSEYRFAEAQKTFAEVAKADATRRNRMAYYEVLCLYGLGQDEEASRKAATLAETCDDSSVQAEATLWLAKFTYNRGDWAISARRFLEYVRLRPESPTAPLAFLWATRAAFAANDLAEAISTVTQFAERYPEAKELPSARVVQAEALIEQGRFDEAVLVLERVSLATQAAREDRLRASILKADALFALGADNSIRYENALEAYRSVSFSAELDADLRLSIAFKIGRVLEKLRRPEEAIDQYYSEVVLAYRAGRMNGVRFGDEARAAFSRAAFRLADLFEARGRDRSAVDILQLVVESTVSSADEASKRIDRILKKGRFL